MSNEFFMAMVPPTVTHQEKQVRVARYYMRILKYPSHLRVMGNVYILSFCHII